MKKSLLALAIAALASSSAATAATVYDKDGSSLDVYGRVQGVLYSTHAATYNSYDDSSLQATGRLGFNMRTNLTSGIDAFANLEWDVADGHDNKSFGVRYAYLGADFGSFGVLKAGHFEDALKYVISATDIFDDFGTNGQFDSDRRDGMFMYSWSGYGLDANISYQTAQDKQKVARWYLHQDGADYNYIEINNAYAISLGYTSAPVLFGPIAIKAGYSHIYSQKDDTSSENLTIQQVDYVSTWASALSWGNLDDGLYLATLVNNRKIKDYYNKDNVYKHFGIEAVAAYTFNNGISLRTGYNYHRYKEEDGNQNKVSARVIPVYVNYQVNSAFNVWAEARFDAGTDDIYNILLGTNYDKEVYSLGARFTF